MNKNGCHMPQSSIRMKTDSSLRWLQAPTPSMKHKSPIAKDFQFTGLQSDACEHSVFSCYLFFVYNLLGALVYSSVDSTG